MKFYKHSLSLIVVYSLIAVQLVYPWLDSVDMENGKTELLIKKEMRFCYITFVSVDGKKFLVKQKKSDCLRKLVGVVRDAVMAHFAENFINAHQVDIIPAGKKFAGKMRTDWPATIHTIAPGKMIKEQNSAYNRMDIKQGDIGFRPDMLYWMAQDEELVKVVAYDTFHCNHDRHRGNLFRDPKTGLFCAIDMDSAFKYNLCALACKNFKILFKMDTLKLKKKEIDALVAYKDYLQFLIDNHKPEQMLEMYDYFVVKAGFVKGADFFLPKFAVEIEHNKKVIVESYEDAKRLVKIIEKVVKRKRKSEIDDLSVRSELFLY